MVIAGLQIASGGESDSLVRNTQIAYRVLDDTFVMTRVAHPFPQDSPNWIAGAIQIATIPAADFYSLSGQWTTTFRALSMPGATRTFDPGLRTNEVGQVEACMQVLASTSAKSGWPATLYDYRVARVQLGDC